MSSADDVMEMQSLCSEIASRVSGQGREKERVAALSRQLGVGWNRALEFLRGKARRVDSWEKDNARRQLAELRRLEAVNHIGNLSRTLEYLRQADPDGYGSHVAAMERSLAAAGLLDSAVDEATGTESKRG